MPAHIVGQIPVRDSATYDRHRELVSPTIAAYGGRYLARGGSTETLEGTWRPTRLVIVEFPSAERAREWWSSPEYAPAKALRQQSADTEMVLLEGLSPAASAALSETSRGTAAR